MNRARLAADAQARLRFFSHEAFSRSVREGIEVEPGKPTRRKLLHLVFEIGVLAKGVDGALELAGGLLLFLLSAAQIRGTILFLVQGELAEDPTDLVANLLLHSTSNVIQSRLPAGAFLIVHGAVKLALVGGLATNRLWAYPAAIVVFAGFAAYQLVQLTRHFSLFLGAVTVLDLAVVVLILAEYRHVRSARRGLT